MAYDPYAIANPWWQKPQAPMQGTQFGQPATQPATQPPNTAKQPGLLEMGLNIGRMTRPQYDQAIKGGGMPPGAAAQVSPWAWLGSMGGGGR